MHKRHTKQDKPKGVQPPIFALNVKQTCTALGGISPPTYYKLVAADQLKTFTIGRRRMATPAAILECIENRQKAGL